MKRYLFLLLLLVAVTSRAQVFYGYTIADFLVDAVHPNGCNPNYVLNLPDDSTWVNFKDGDIITGTFGQRWTDTTWEELLLETSYHEDNYTVSLYLSNGTYSATHFVSTVDWTQIPDTPWVHLFTSCNVGREGRARYILPLDFRTHFGLTNADTVVGIRIEFRATTGDPDLAGVYIVTQVPPPNQLSLGRDTTLCQGQSLLLNATLPGATSYRWQDNYTGPTYTVTQAGTYWVRVIDNNNTYRDTITVSYVSPPAFSLGRDTTLCPGNTLTLNATTPGATYLWQNNSTGPTFTVTQAGTYWAQVNLNGCAKRDSITVNYLSLSAVNLGADTTICQGSTLTLNATTPGATYRWQDNSTAPTYSATQAGTYWVRVTVNSCSSADTLQLSLSPAPPANLGPDTTLCPGDTLRLDASTPNATYRWQDNSTQPGFSVTQAGTYHVQVTANGCSRSDTIRILPRPALLVNLGPDTTLCREETIMLDATNTDARYIWQDSSTGATLTVSEPGTYWVQVSGCDRRSDTVVVAYEGCDCLMYFPNSFTPNGDNLNDGFLPFYDCELTVYRFMIFNRWGEKIFETGTPGEAWDGSRDGTPAPIEDYIFLVEYRYDGEEKPLQVHGRVTLIR